MFVSGRHPKTFTKPDLPAFEDRDSNLSTPDLIHIKVRITQVG